MRPAIVRATTAILLFGLTVPVQAQIACTVSSDGCQKAQDVYTYLFPQLGKALAGGHPILGGADMLGGFGHFSIGVRATGVFGSMPDLDAVPVTTGAPVQSTIPTSDAIMPGPAVDGAIGLYGGFPLGVTRVGGVDALASVSYLPAPSEGDTEYDLPDGSTGVGLGLRVGLLEESIILPGLSVAYLRRPLPTVTWRATSDEGVVYGVEDFEIDVGTWRVVAVKSFLLFTLSGGFGGDMYESSGVLLASSPGSGVPEQRLSISRDVNRSTWFVGLTFGLGPIKVAAEYGGVSGGELTTFNTFDPGVGASRNFASVGVRFGM